jgi:glycosidase
MKSFFKTLCLIFFAPYLLIAQGFDPEQRVPDGKSKPVPKRIPAVATTESFTPRIDPASWWVGMKNPSVELMIHDRNIQGHSVVITHKGLTIKKIDRPENHNYLFVTLNIAPTAMLGDVTIKLTKGSDIRTHKWRLDRLNTEGGRNQGLKTSDFIYLIMPDRFANGDPTNDSFDDMLQTGIDRRKMFFRHGGDLKGVSDRIDYLKELGVTALWLNPVQENDQIAESYHGYAMTDLYRIDRRFGSNADYKNLVDKLHQNGMKMVMDIAPNHCGNNAYFIKDLPEANFIHQYDSFTRTTYRDQVVFDPHASEGDRSAMEDGWFDVTMPDMNPEGNVHCENFLIQSYIWWLAYSGLDAIRIDTYLYNDPLFMARLANRIRREFPRVHLFGETWVHGIINQAYSVEKTGLKKKFDSRMQGVTDFQLYFALQEALTKPQGWTEGITRLYQNMANDFIYENAADNVTFIDNHDLARFFSVLNEDVVKYKSAIAWLLTVRGIPQWYYGAELGFTGLSNPDGKVRQDMPGGWKEDERSVFTEGGRNDREKELFNFTKKLANYRKSQPALHDGKMMQFLPMDGVYVYFRYNPSATIMVVMNTSDKDQTIETKRFKERLSGFNTAKDVLSDKTLSDISKLTVKKSETLVLELKP